jgi:hypothetical protein
MLTRLPMLLLCAKDLRGAGKAMPLVFALLTASALATNLGRQLLPLG